WRDARAASEACPTGAVAIQESGDSRQVTVDYGRCIYCGECAVADTSGAVQMTQQFELAAPDRRNLVMTAEYGIDSAGIQHELKKIHHGYWPAEETSEQLDREVRQQIYK